MSLVLHTMMAGEGTASTTMSLPPQSLLVRFVTRVNMVATFGFTVLEYRCFLEPAIWFGLV
jgi:hypothetical protein